MLVWRPLHQSPIFPFLWFCLFKLHLRMMCVSDRPKRQKFIILSKKLQLSSWNIQSLFIPTKSMTRFTLKKEIQLHFLKDLVYWSHKKLKFKVFWQINENLRDHLNYLVLIKFNCFWWLKVILDMNKRKKHTKWSLNPWRDFITHWKDMSISCLTIFH